VDRQRNGEAATAIAPWSLRARPGAPVACPVSWEELSRIDSASAYDLVRARRRITALKRDPWEGYGKVRQNVPDLPD
jgi:bifunctional non-homologous end joining protein LigD